MISVKAYMFFIFENISLTLIYQFLLFYSKNIITSVSGKNINS